MSVFFLSFLPDLFDFSANEKDNINDETCELLEPYLKLENFNPAIAKKASNAAEGVENTLETSGED